MPNAVPTQPTKERPANPPTFPKPETGGTPQQITTKNPPGGPYTPGAKKTSHKKTNAKVRTALDAEVDKLLSRQSTDAAN